MDQNAYEVHLHAQGRKERVANGGGLLMNGNGQHLQMEGRVYGDHRDERDLTRMETADGGRLDSSAAVYDLCEGSRVR